MPPTVPQRRETDLPYLVERYRDFLHGLDRVRRQVEGRAAVDGVAAGTLRGDAATVRATLADLLSAETAAALEVGIPADSDDLSLTLALMALTGDATFAALPGWGHGAAPPLAADHPLPGPQSLADRVEALTDSTRPQPHRAQLYLLALAAGAGAAIADPAERQALADGYPELARMALGTHLGGVAAVGGGDADGDLLFPTAYPAPRRHGPARELLRVRLWLAAVPASAALFLGLTLLTWWSLIHGLDELVCEYVARMTP